MISHIVSWLPDRIYHLLYRAPPGTQYCTLSFHSPEIRVCKTSTASSKNIYTFQTVLSSIYLVTDINTCALTEKKMILQTDYFAEQFVSL